MKSEVIISVNPVIPSKGTDSGKQMYLINGTHWSKQKPEDTDTHVVLEEVQGEGEYEGKTFINVVGFSKDIRMSIADKIALIKEHDASYSTAIAMLLK